MAGTHANVRGVVQFGWGDSGVTLDGSAGSGSQRIAGGSINGGASDIAIRDMAFTDLIQIVGGLHHLLAPT